MATPDRISLKALNRTYLARQRLLERSPGPIPATIEQLVGLQAQSPQAPYFGLWSRVQEFQPNALSSLIETRQVVRVALMRSTIHTVTARDCLALRPLLQPVQERGLKGTFGKRLAGMDMEALVAEGRALVEEQPLTLGNLGQRLLERWPDRDPQALANAVRAYIPLIQVPPRGLWATSGQATHTSAEAWLGQSPITTETIEALLLRYLAAFGPATVNDIQVWSGLTGLRATVAAMKAQLRTWHDDTGRELFDIPDAPLPDPETPAPPRFLPEFDNALLSHVDRSRILPPAYHRQVFAENRILPTVLLDGFVAGTWKLKQERQGMALIVGMFKPLSAAARAQITEEGERLLAFAATASSTSSCRLIVEDGD